MVIPGYSLMRHLESRLFGNFHILATILFHVMQQALSRKGHGSTKDEKTTRRATSKPPAPRLFIDALNLNKQPNQPLEIEGKSSSNTSSLRGSKLPPCLAQIGWWILAGTFCSRMFHILYWYVRQVTERLC